MSPSGAGSRGSRGPSSSARAVLTEAVSGVVGTADVLGGLGALLALASLGLPLWGMPLGVFVAMLIGLFSKESALVCVPLVPLAALFLAPYTHREKPRAFWRMLVALLATTARIRALRRVPQTLVPVGHPPRAARTPARHRGASRAGRARFSGLVSPAVAPPRPPEQSTGRRPVPYRIAGALRVYFRGLLQLVFPNTLSGDYSSPQEPAPDRLIFPESVLGAAAMVLPPLLGVLLWIRSIFLERQDVVGGRQRSRRKAAQRKIPMRPPDEA